MPYPNSVYRLSGRIILAALDLAIGSLQASSLHDYVSKIVSKEFNIYMYIIDVLFSRAILSSITFLVV